MINISMEKEAKNGEFEICEKLEGGVVVSFLNVKTAKESRAFNKDIGEYFILDFKKDELFNKKTQNSLVGSAHKCINKLLASLNVDLTKKGALVVGLGNEQIIADAFGAFVAKKILVTRPFVLNDKNKSMIPVSAITPDIYLKTGIETFDMISGVCKSIDPAIVVLIDSYGTKKLERVGCSLQLSSSGLVPGGAILGDKKLKAISKKTLKIPCITIGCPLMCFAEDGFVTILQNVDTVVELLSQIAAEAINNAFSV